MIVLAITWLLYIGVRESVRANNIIAVPGLGFHHDNHFVYMRLCVPMYDDGMAAADFQKQILAVVGNARDFLGAFRAIVGGEPGEKVMALAQKSAESTPRA